MLRDRAEREYREEGERRKYVDDAYEHHGEDRRIGVQRPGRIRHKPFFHQGAGDGQLQHNGDVSAEKHGQTGRDVPEQGVIRQPLEAGAVVGGGGGELIQYLGQPVEARVGDGLPPRGRADRQGGKRQDQQRVDDDAQGGELHLAPFDFFAQIFRRPPDHQPADEHGQDGV